LALHYYSIVVKKIHIDKLKRYKQHVVYTFLAYLLMASNNIECIAVFYCFF